MAYPSIPSRQHTPFSWDDAARALDLNSPQSAHARQSAFGKYERHWYLGTFDQEMANEAALTEWWTLLGLPRLPSLIDLLLRQSLSLSMAHLALKKDLALIPLTSGDSEADARSAHLWIARMARYQHARLTTISNFASTYVQYLSLSERLRNIVDGMARQQSIADDLLNHGAAPGPMLVGAMQIRRLHAKHELVSAARDESLLSLSAALCEPFDVTYSRVLTDELPSSPAPQPSIGTPHDMIMRRPDLIAHHHEVQFAIGSPFSDTSTLEYEYAKISARTDVERAIRRTRARHDELSPLRANVESDQELVQRLHESTARKRSSLATLSDAQFSLCIHRDHEIDVRGATYAASVDVFRSLGAGWPCEEFLRPEDDAEPLA